MANRRRVIPVVIIVVIAILAAAGLVVLRAQPAAAAAPAILTIYKGTATVLHPGVAAAATEHSGAALGAGDAVTTGPESRAAITYFDGSTTRLDALTTVRITKLSRDAGHGYQIANFDSAGQTWNRVVRLGTGSSFSVRGPNNSTAEVRGTEFTFSIHKNAAGKPAVHLDTWSGVVQVTAAGHTVAVAKGSQTIVEAGRPPSAIAPIPPSDKKDSFTVFNIAADHAESTSNKAPAISTNVNTLSPGQSTERQEGATSDGNSDLAFTLAWPGSTMELVVVDPDGAVYASEVSDSPPVTIGVAHARAGHWGYRVHDIKSDRAEVWSVAVAVQSPSRNLEQPIFAGGASCAHTVAAGATDSWSLSAKSASGRPAFRSDPLPAFATFADNGDGTATVTFAPPAELAPPSDVLFNVFTEIGGGSSELSCVEHLQASPSSVGGSVTQPDGSGVSGAAVTLVGAVGPGFAATTDDKGTFGFSALLPGAYAVTVSAPDGYLPSGPSTASLAIDGSTRLAALAFQMVPTPAVASVSPSSGMAAGGTSVTIIGRGFTGATAVGFGPLPATSFSIDSDQQVTAVSPTAPAGRVDVTVTTSSATSPASPDDGFVYGQSPVVGKSSPSGGPGTGGTAVTLDGSGFSGATAVSFGPNQALDFRVLSDAQLFATSPPGSGVVDLIVSTVIDSSPAVASAQFAYSGPAPAGRSVTSTAPLHGPDSGGTTVTISGSGFATLGGVLFGAAASAFYVLSDNQVQVTTPSGPGGPARITLSWPDGSPASIVAADSFTFDPPPAASASPVISAVSPNTVDAVGGTIVEITGAGFTGVTDVSFGGVGASFNVLGDGQLEAKAPAGKGAVDIVITSGSGSSQIGAEDQVTYLDSVPPISPGPPPSPSPTPAGGPSPTPVDTPNPSPSLLEPSPAPAVTPSPSPSPAATDSPSPSLTDTPAPLPSPAVTDTPSPIPTATPSPAPTDTPTPAPIDTPTPVPSPSPTDAPSPPPPAPSPTPDPSPIPVPSPT